MYCGLSTASEVFLIFATQLYHIYAIIMQYFYILTRGKYCNRNTPNPNTSLSSLPVGSKLSHCFCYEYGPNCRHGVKPQTLTHSLTHCVRPSDDECQPARGDDGGNQSRHLTPRPVAGGENGGGHETELQGGKGVTGADQGGNGPRIVTNHIKEVRV